MTQQPSNEQKLRVIFEFLGCSHIYNKQDGRWKCKKCDKWDRLVEVIPNYFARDLADNIRVEMVTAAFEKLGWSRIRARLRTKGVLDPGSAPISGELPASVIAEAIYTLIQEQNDGNN